MLKDLRDLQTPIATKLYNSVKTRIEERRNYGMSTLLAYLSKPKFLETTHEKILHYATRGELVRLARILYDRLFQNHVPALTQVRVSMLLSQSFLPLQKN